MDIFIADSGRPIRNNGVCVFVTPVGSSTIQRRQDGINRYSSPSGYNGVVTPSIYYTRFDDLGYIYTAHSGHFYGGSITRDDRQTQL